MKANTVFSIAEGMVKYLQISSAAPKKLVTGVDVLDIRNLSDAQISQSLISSIRQRKLNFAENRVTVLIPRSRVILRHMKLPSQKEDEIRSMIDLQVGGQIPYSKEEVELDFQVLAKTPDGYSKVAVIIIPQETAARYWKIFSDARVPVHKITVSTIGLWSLYLQQAEGTERPAAIFDIDTDHTEICLCYKDQWLTSREIPIGLTRMRQEGYAEVLKQWGLTLMPEKAGSVYLASCTEQAGLLGIELVGAQEDLTVKEICMIKTLELAKGTQWPKPVSEDGVSMAALAGIALSTETPPIDLTPNSVRQAEARLVYQRQIIVAGIWAGAAVISLVMALGIGFFNKNIQLARLENQLRSTKQEASGVEEQLQKIQDIEGMIKDRLIFADLAHEIYRLLPAQIYLAGISINNGDTLSLQGVSSNAVEINQFQRDMVNSPIFSNVNLDYVNKRVTQNGEVDYFKITCSLRPRNDTK